ncbi:MAG: hypothetical protein ACP5NW_01290, partial [Candidatus Woesearchaeota archaeon]
AVFETNTGFNLGKLAPFALLILFLAVGIFLYNFLSQVISSKWAAVSVAFLIIYSLLQFVAPAAIAWINKVGWLGTMLSLFYMIAVIGLIYSLISMIGGIRGSGSSSGGGLFGGRSSGRNNDNDNDRNITDENKKTWLERDRERQATANIAKLDVDLSTLNNNVAQLAKLESEIESRELNNRRVQIKTLQDLQNALNGAWRVQAELQKAYRNISRPEYANNQTAIDSITSGSQQLSEFVLKVEKLLMLLKENFEKEVTDEEKELQVRNELENSLKKIDATVANYTEATLKISKVMNRLKKAGAPDDYTQILKVIDDRAKLFSNLKPILIKINEMSQKIKELDKSNITDLDHALKVTTDNPARDINELKRVVNWIVDKTKKPESVGTLQGWINTKNKYLSGDSIKQIYASLGTINTRLRKIVEELALEKNNTMKERNLLIDKCNKLETAINQELFTKLIAAMKLEKTGAQQKISTQEKVLMEIDRIYNDMMSNHDDDIKKQIPSLESKVKGGSLEPSLKTVDDMYNKRTMERIQATIDNANIFIKDIDKTADRDSSKNKVTIIRKNLSNELVDMKKNMTILDEVMNVEVAIATEAKRKADAAAAAAPIITPKI